MSNMESLHNSPDMRSMPLHVVTERYGIDGLEAQFRQYVDDLDCEGIDKMDIVRALDMALVVHEGQMRDKHCYATHVVRVASRIIKHFGVKNPDIIKAALLHDSVEDRPGRFLPNSTAMPAQEAKNPSHQPDALMTIADNFTEHTAELVADLTNPQFNPALDTHDQYREHIRDTMMRSPDARIIKMSDFIDNCKGLKYNELSPKRVTRLAKKYYPLIPVMRHYATDKSTPLPEHGREYILDSLDIAKERCGAILIP